MKLNLNLVTKNLLRLLLISAMATLAVGCSSSSDPADETMMEGEGDEFGEGEGEGDGFGDGTGEGEGEGTTDFTPDCLAVDCYSDDASWTNNAQVSQLRSPTSNYAKGIQRILWCQGYSDAADVNSFADGIYGPNTALAVEAFQGDEGLLVDGIVGEQTWTRLQEQLTVSVTFDATLDAHYVTSLKCEGQALFYQDVAEPRAWSMSQTLGSIARVPFGIDLDDVPLQ